MKWLRLHIVRNTILLIFLIAALLIADAICYQFTLPVRIVRQNKATILYVGSNKITLENIGIPKVLQFTSSDKVIHEYQIDGTDSTNNYTLDQAYMDKFASSPYYRFQAWMRDLNGTSHWRNVSIEANNQQVKEIAQPADDMHVTLPSEDSWQLTMQLQRPETPRTFYLLMENNTSINVVLDRNDRYIKVTQTTPKGSEVQLANSFFPTDGAPFAAMVLDQIIRTMLWSTLLLLVVLICEGCLASLPLRKFYTLVISRSSRHTANIGEEGIRASNSFMQPINRQPLRAIQTFIWQRYRRLTAAIHPLALLALCTSLCFVAWIAKVQYNGEPHIFDASAYLFAAKMYALGQFSVPIPAASDHFPGPFMIQFAGRWFAQYPPGTALTLVPGIWLGLPWLVEPLLGTLALLGIGLIAARLYNRQVATLAVLLGTLSPFYSYLAASYMSHAIALFYLVWGTWAIVRFLQGAARWHLPLSAFFFGMAALTRDLVGVLFIVIMVTALIMHFQRQVRNNWRRWRLPTVFFVTVVLLFVGISLCFNANLTQSVWVAPRQLFFAGDRWGFGQGIGFYGEHTLAAGFVNLDELLTILTIDLYGWPCYFTLAFIALPFLTRRAKSIDWLLLSCTCVMASAYLGYFYHGIYLGPRYLFETLPFLLMLTARGILTLTAIGCDVRHMLQNRLQYQIDERAAGTAFPTSLVTVALLLALISCNLLYFLPRQIILHQNYSGLASGSKIDLPTLYHPSLHNALVVTNDFSVYQFVLFPLNDPYLKGNVIYAISGDATQTKELQIAYPGRTLYQLLIAPDGSIQYKKIASNE